MPVWLGKYYWDGCLSCGQRFEPGPLQARYPRWPVTVGLKTLGALVAARPAKPCFRRWTRIRGTYRSKLFLKALRSSSQRIALTFAAPRVPPLWNPEDDASGSHRNTESRAAFTCLSDELLCLGSLARSVPEGVGYVGPVGARGLHERHRRYAGRLRRGMDGSFHIRKINIVGAIDC